MFWLFICSATSYFGVIILYICSVFEAGVFLTTTITLNLAGPLVCIMVIAKF
jgi:hypothetical protein